MALSPVIKVTHQTSCLLQENMFFISGAVLFRSGYKFMLIEKPLPLPLHLQQL